MTEANDEKMLKKRLIELQAQAFRIIVQRDNLQRDLNNTLQHIDVTQNELNRLKAKETDDGDVSERSGKPADPK